MSTGGQLNEKHTTYSLSQPQKRVWLGESMHTGTPVYNLGGVSIIHGAVDFEILEKSINIFIKKNDGLRLQMLEKDGEVQQYVKEFIAHKIDFFDFSKSSDFEAEFIKWSEEELSKPFIFNDSRLYYIATFKKNQNINGIFVKFHHIISDGWSIQIASEDIYGIYMSLLNGEAINEENEYSYLEYLENEQQYLTSDKFLKNKSYWNEKFEYLPEDIEGVSSQEIKGNRTVFNLDNSLSDKIQEFVKNYGCSVNTFFVAIMSIYLSRIKNSQEVVIGTPVLNRSNKREKSMFGMFTSSMPLRLRVDEKCQIAELFKDINQELKAGYKNQKYPYNILVQDLELQKKGYDSLFQICVNYYNTKLYTEVNGELIENIEMYNGYQLYSLQIVIKEWQDKSGLSLSFDYKTSEYTEKQIKCMYQSFVSIAKQILDKPTQSISKLELLSDEEKYHQIVRFNETSNEYPDSKTICQLFEQQVKMIPERIAVSFENKELTYSELNKKANQLARFLIKKNIMPDTVVGLMVTHSIEALIGILGIIKAGGAYMPIDPEYPTDRIQFMLNDSETKILLTNCNLNNNQIDELSFKGQVLDLNDASLYMGIDTDLPTISKPNNLVYVIYTSGSTGKPKGVMIEHKGLVNYIWWAKKMYVKSDNEVFALYSSLSFDLTVTSVFAPLISGSKIIVYRNDGEEYVLYRIMKENKATVIKLTPSHLTLLSDMDNRHSSVKRFIVGGEDLKVSLAQRIHNSFGGDIEILNEYGPTETVVGCMIYKYDNKEDTNISVPIGIPADNVQIYLLDKFLKPLPIGCLGEMYISGDGIARGYLNRDELTKERFIENPYIKGSYMYKTGDLAKFLDNGQIEYSGRVDQQIKIHGYRIEIGEIEKHLVSHKLISKAVVIDFQNANGDKYLCAYLVTLGDVTYSEVRKYLLGFLPQYMVPLAYAIIDEIPLTQNGKVNRNRLPTPEFIGAEEEEYVAPSNEIEKALITVVSDVLGTKEIGVKSNFFQHGGDSIKAIQIASKLHELGYKIGARDILSRSTMDEIAACVVPDISNISQGSSFGVVKPTPIISWFKSQEFKDISYYNQSVILYINKNTPCDRFGIIMDELIKHHDSLRLNLDLSTGELFYNEKHLNQKSNVKSYDLSQLSQVEQDIRMKELERGFKASFDIEKDVLIKACLFDLGDMGKKLLITAHHIVIDAVSWRIVLEDIYNLLKQLVNKEAFRLPLKTNSYIEWQDGLEKYSINNATQQSTYWNDIINQEFIFPKDMDESSTTLGSIEKVSFELDIEETEALLYRTRTAFGTEPHELMIAALVKAASDLSAKNEVILEFEGHGREDIIKNVDVTRTVGWFTSIYPVVFRQTQNELPSFIKAIKEQYRNVPDKGIGFGVLKYMTELIPDTNNKYIRFNYLGDFNETFENEYFKCRYESTGEDSSPMNHMTSLMDINAAVMSKRLKVTMTYSNSIFYKQTMEKFLKYFKDNLVQIIDYCCSKESTEFTPSDFDLVKLDDDDLDSLLI